MRSRIARIETAYRNPVIKLSTCIHEVKRLLSYQRSPMAARIHTERTAQ